MRRGGAMGLHRAVPGDLPRIPDGLVGVDVGYHDLVELLVHAAPALRQPPREPRRRRGEPHGAGQVLGTAAARVWVPRVWVIENMSVNLLF